MRPLRSSRYDAEGSRLALTAIVSLSRGGILSLAGELVYIVAESVRRDDGGGRRFAEGESKLVSLSFVPRPAAPIVFCISQIFVKRSKFGRPPG